MKARQIQKRNTTNPLDFIFFRRSYMDFIWRFNSKKNYAQYRRSHNMCWTEKRDMSLYHFDNWERMTEQQARDFLDIQDIYS